MKGDAGSFENSNFISSWIQSYKLDKITKPSVILQVVHSTQAIRRRSLKRQVVLDEAAVVEAPQAHPLVRGGVALHGVRAEQAVEGLVRATGLGGLALVFDAGRRAALLAVLFVGDEVDELGGAGALAPGGRSGVGGRGEVELGPGPADVARGGVVGERGGLGGGEGAEPDAHALVLRCLPCGACSAPARPAAPPAASSASWSRRRQRKR